MIGNRNSVGGVGFLSDYRRVNVAMTRAKHSFWVVGDCDTLVVDPVWKNFVEDAARRSLIRDAVAFWNIFSSHSGTSRQCNNYYTKGKSIKKRNTHANNRKRKMG
jgi:superfamily I DNA and/or RNA helicase